MSNSQPSALTHQIVENPRCPLCGTQAPVYRRTEVPEVFEGKCGVCGSIRMLDSAAEEARHRGKAHLVSAWLRRRPPQTDAILELDDLERILKDTPEYSVLEKIELTLTQVSLLTPEPGLHSNIQVWQDYPLVYARTGDELLYYMRQLAREGYVTEQSAFATMTAKGYERLAEIQRASRQSSFAFVAMWFDASLDVVYDQAIAPAIRRAGYRPVRIDREQHANRIDDEIMGRMKSSRFMVADFTGQRQGVYFEAGYMCGLGRTVIWMCRRDALHGVHFDTRQYNFIDYENVADAEKRLYDRIWALEGQGPEHVAGSS